MPRCLPSASASVDLPAPIIPAMPMKMLPNTSGAWPRTAEVGREPSACGDGATDGVSVPRGSGPRTISVCTGGACQTALTSRSTPSRGPAGEPIASLDRLEPLDRDVVAAAVRERVLDLGRQPALRDPDRQRDRRCGQLAEQAVRGAAEDRRHQQVVRADPRVVAARREVVEIDLGERARQLLVAVRA